MIEGATRDSSVSDLVCGEKYNAIGAQVEKALPMFKVKLDTRSADNREKTRI
jgi:hypothetical protein